VRKVQGQISRQRLGLDSIAGLKALADAVV